MRGRLPGWTAAVAAVIAYFVILLPYGSTPLISHPDERHYAYAGIRMVESGNWLVPHTPGDEVRLKKPILPYWFAAAGFKVLGVGVPGFRLFWILAACATLALTFALARVLGASENASLLAMFLTAANPLFLRSAVQSIPDMPLTLFMMTATLGFSIILAKTDEPPRYAAWLAWIGIALGILTKGILPLVFAIFVVVFTAVFVRKRLRFLLAPLPILAALGLIAFWFIYAIRNHPTEFFAQFFSDQVTGKVTFDPLRVMRQLPSYLATGVISFFGLPLVLAIAWWRSSPRAPVLSWPFVLKLLFAWAIAVLVMFSFGPFVAGRYLLPILPIISVLTFIGFEALTRGDAALYRASTWILGVVSLALIALLAAGSAIEAQLAPLWESVAYIALVTAMTAWMLRTIWKPAYAPMALPWAVILAVGLLFVPIARLVQPTIAVPIASRLSTSPNFPLPLVSIQQSPAMYLRLLTRRSEPYLEIKNIQNVDFGNACIVVTDREDFAQKLRDRGFTVEIVRGGYDAKLNGLFTAILQGRLAEAREENASTAYFATCKS